MKSIVYDSVAVNRINCLEIDLFMEKLSQETVCFIMFFILNRERRLSQKFYTGIHI